ncbi:Probable ABC-type transport system, permease component. Putative Lipoprotein-releasing system transmembrane protein [Tenacibaculum maritimum]|nr:Probable ABC-type transport system, permease component. Putative Lipoprotein-releasing system transmembrane protein [Tenacibaculum maritimum]
MLKLLRFPYYIAKRYLFTKASNNAINIITLIASFGVIVGSLALFIILSGFSGLRTFSDSLLATSDPDIKISAAKGKSFFFTDEIQKVLEGASEVKLFSRVVEERVFLKYKDKEHIAQIKGVDTGYNKITQIDSALFLGQWLDPEFKNMAVLGNGISNKLSLGILNYSEPLEIYVPKPGKGYIMNPAAAFNKVKAQIIGLYSGNEEFENKFVFVDIFLAQDLLRYKENQLTAIEIKLKNSLVAKEVKNKLQKKLGGNFRVQTKAELNALFYKVINTENFVSYLIFTLIVIIALFNVVGAIIMMIIDKRQNLKTLLNIGATVNDIKRIFILQGFLLTVVGMFIGIAIGVVLVFLQKEFGWFMITRSLPYPVEFRWTNLFIVMGTITLLGFIASKIASSRISKSFIEQ